MINSVDRTSKNYYLQLFLEECKYVVKEKITEHITDDIKSSSDYFDEENSVEENSNEEN